MSLKLGAEIYVELPNGDRIGVYPTTTLESWVELRLVLHTLADEATDAIMKLVAAESQKVFGTEE